mmetsp:Transcript_9028/g.34073  ORF Transcript_9028/g.34073 Transcript_9028/m.34073 type:complete len:99 (+) Transcript_9028:244-540(+)
MPAPVSNNAAEEDGVRAKGARSTSDVHDALDFKLLLKLKEYFYPNGSHENPVSLDEGQFVHALSEVLGIEASTTGLRNLFMKVKLENQKPSDSMEGSP